MSLETEAEDVEDLAWRYRRVADLTRHNIEEGLKHPTIPTNMHTSRSVGIQAGKLHPYLACKPVHVVFVRLVA
jgi:hypothetical protein